MAPSAMRRGGPALNVSLTIIVLTPLTTFFARVRACAEPRRQAYEFVGVFLIVMPGPAWGRHKRAMTFRALLPCVGLIAFGATSARAQSLTPNLFNPVQNGFVAPQDLPLRRTINQTVSQTIDKTGEDADAREASRQGRTRAFPHRQHSDLRPARRQWCGGFRIRLAQPHAQETETLSRTGEAETVARSRQPRAARPAGDADRCAAAAVDSAVRDCQQDAAGAGDGRHRRGPAAAQAPEGRRRSVRRGRRLRRQLSRQVGDRTQRRLRHQSRPVTRAERIAVLCGRAGIPRRLRLGPPRVDRRSAGIVHRLWRHPSVDDRWWGLAGADQCQPAGFHRPYRWPPSMSPTIPA